ncbi:MAG: hypothetical protein JXA82_03155 [Sedimentisphaerales bacterium]|nr:hypothetical protein [Sedimentisphaerales bacterium]
MYREEMERIRTIFGSAQHTHPEGHLVEETLSDKSIDNSADTANALLPDMANRIPDLAETCLRQLDTLESIHTRLPQLRERCHRLTELLQRTRDQLMGSAANGKDHEKSVHHKSFELDTTQNPHNVEYSHTGTDKESDGIEMHQGVESMEYSSKLQTSTKSMQTMLESKNNTEISGPTVESQEAADDIDFLNESIDDTVLFEEEREQASASIESVPNPAKGSEIDSLQGILSKETVSHTGDSTDDSTESADQLLHTLDGLDEELLQCARATERAVRELFSTDDEHTGRVWEIDEDMDQAEDLGLALTMGKRRKPVSVSKFKSVSRILDELHGKVLDLTGSGEGYEPAAYEDWLAELEQIEADLNEEA